MFTDTEYVEVQNYPIIIIAKSEGAESNLIEYMNNEGFSEDYSGRMGSVVRFENDVSAQYIQFSVNGYFSEWRWRE